MYVKKSTVVAISLLISVLQLKAQPAAISVIDTSDMRKHLTFISSDEMQGRRLGTEIDGLAQTADYLGDYVKKLGLKEGAPEYFQKVQLEATSPDKTNFVEVLNDRNKSLFLTNSLIELNNPMIFRDPKKLDVVFAGFGDDLSNIKIAGKAVIISAGSQKDFKENNHRWNNRLERAKIEEIEKMDPGAILFVTHPADKGNSVYKQIAAWFTRDRYALKQAEGSAEPPILIVLPEVADEILGGKGKYRKYLNNIVKSNKNEFSEIKKRQLRIKAGKLSKPTNSKNVVAYLDGSDPILKEECVVFMGHYDHLGVDENGDVFNGADDNGSGTVAIMEVAQAFSKLEVKPKRSIVFLWVTAEEIGLFGSQYYTENPVFPLENTVACFNLDMVGRVFEPRDTVWNRSPKRVKDFDGLFTLSNDVWPELARMNDKYCEQLNLVPDTTLPSQFLRSSDHYHFHKNGVPILNYATGYHADYHKVGDEVDKINFEKIKRVAELCFLMGLDVANQPEINFKQP